MMLAPLFLLAAAGVPAVPWKQDRFAISFWVDPVVPPAQFDFEYNRIRAANFTVLLGGFGATNPQDVALQIAAAQKAGLAAVPSICGGSCANLTGAWGFQIADEPAVAAFPAVAKLVADAKAVGQMAFVNLLPNYASPAQLGAPSYGEYVRQFVRDVKPNMLSVDHYPDFGQPSQRNNKTTAGYILNLLALREASLSVTPHIPFWNFFNAMPYGSTSQFDISEAELRWQAYTSLAIGSKGVLYFCYWTPAGSDFTRGQAIMTPTPGSKPDNSNQSPGSKYPMVQRINSKLRTLGNWLLPRFSSAVVQVSQAAGSTSNLEGLPLTSINGTDVGPSWEFMLGCYDANKTILVVNQDSNHPALATVAGAVASMMEVHPQTGQTAPALDDAPFHPGFQIHLNAGDGRLFTWA
jgi:hypothetical protein